MDHFFCFYSCFRSGNCPALGIPYFAASHHVHFFCKGDGHHVNNYGNKKTCEQVAGFSLAGLLPGLICAKTLFHFFILGIGYRITASTGCLFRTSGSSSAIGTRATGLLGSFVHIFTGCSPGGIHLSERTVYS